MLQLDLLFQSVKFVLVLERDSYTLLLERYTFVFLNLYCVEMYYKGNFLLQMSTMPGLPTRPAIFDIDLNLETGNIEGLF